MTNLEAALEYVRRGYPVVPVFGIDDNGHCECARGARCPVAGKHPAGRDWQLNPSRTESEAERMFGEKTFRNVGILLGSPLTHDADTVLVALDLDPRTGAPSLVSFETEYGNLCTRVHTTQGGGWHALFTYSGEHRLSPITEQDEELGAGVAFKPRAGTMIVAPPSRGAIGTYAVLDDRDPAPLPKWLEALAIKASEPRATAGTSTTYGRAALEIILGELAEAEEGDRNNALNRHAFRIGQLIASGDVDEAGAKTRLRATALGLGLGEDEVRATMRSGVKAGQLNPRGPSWEHDGGPDMVEATTEAYDAFRDQFIQVSGVELKEPTYLVHPYIPAGAISLLFGPGGVGKGFLISHTIAAITTGTPFFNGQVPTEGPRNVIYIALEEGTDTLKRRLDAAEVDEDRVWIYDVSRNAHGFVVPRDWKLFGRLCRELDPALIAIDTAISALDGSLSSNSDGDIRQAYQPLVGLLGSLEGRCTAMLVTHEKKGMSDSAQNKVIGGVGWVNLARSAIRLHPKDGAALLTHVKGNDGPRGRALRMDLHSKNLAAAASFREWEAVEEPEPVRAKSYGERCLEWIHAHLTVEGMSAAEMIEGMRTAIPEMSRTSSTPRNILSSVVSDGHAVRIDDVIYLRERNGGSNP